MNRLVWLGFATIWRRPKEEFDGGYVPRKQIFHNWESWFAWRPVKIHGERVWLKHIYRRCINTYVDMDDWKRYEYGTLFDVLRD
jgi:hypothetical protein